MEVKDAVYQVKDDKYVVRILQVATLRILIYVYFGGQSFVHERTYHSLQKLKLIAGCFLWTTSARLDGEGDGDGVQLKLMGEPIMFEAIVGVIGIG